MKVGFIGLGKLGLPVSLAIEDKGHQIYGFDINNSIEGYIKKKIPYREVGANKLLKNKINFVNPKEIVKNCRLIFIVIETPHEKKFEGITRIPKKKRFQL